MDKTNFVKRIFCPICRSSNSVELYSSSFDKPPISKYLSDFYKPQGTIEFEWLSETNYTLDECIECGLVYQRFIPNDFLMNTIYEKWIDPQKVFHDNVLKRTSGYYIKLSREIELSLRHFNKFPNELKYLDFGMGWGEWCRMANAYGCHASGMELSTSRINHAKQFGIQIIDWDDLPQYQFDFINTEQVFEHIADPVETLKILLRSLKPGGVIKISVPNGWDIKRRLKIMNWSAPKGSKNSMNAVAPLEHINCFSYQTLLKMVSNEDLMPIRIGQSLSLNRSIINFSIRDFFKPIEHGVFKIFQGHVGSSICLYLQKAD